MTTYEVEIIREGVTMVVSPHDNRTDAISAFFEALKVEADTNSMSDAEATARHAVLLHTAVTVLLYDRLAPKVSYHHHPFTLSLGLSNITIRQATDTRKESP